MTEREQWRFQWPDGTWIRWNPQTQSWEKEDQGSGAPGRSVEAAPPRTDPPVATPARGEPSSGPRTASGGWKPVADPPAPEAPPIEEPASVRDEPAPLLAEEPRATTEFEEPRHVVEEEPRPEEREPEPVRAPRRSVAEVLPPNEPDRPGGSLWPTVVAGAVVGIAVGLLLSAVVR